MCDYLFRTSCSWLVNYVGERNTQHTIRSLTAQSLAGYVPRTGLTLAHVRRAQAAAVGLVLVGVIGLHV